MRSPPAAAEVITQAQPTRRSPGRVKGKAGPVLTQSMILAAAVRLVEQEGQDALTLRRLAADIGVSPMALYTHFRDKGALIEAIIDTLMGEMDLAALDASSGRRWLETFALKSREMFVNHPGFVRLMAEYPSIGPSALKIGEHAYGVLLGDGATPSMALWSGWGRA